MQFLWKYSKKYKLYLWGSLLTGLSFVIVTLGMPMIFSMVIDQVIVPRHLEELPKYAWILFFLIVFSGVGELLARYFISQFSTRLVFDIRNDVFRKIQQLSHNEFQNFGVPSLSTRLTTDAFMMMQFSIMLLGMGIVSPLMIIFSFYMVGQTSLALGFRISPLLLVIGAILYIVVKRTIPLSVKQQNALDEINRRQRENITGIRVIRAFNREETQVENFKAINQEYQGYALSLFKMIGTTQPAFMFTISLSLVFVLWFGAGYISNGSLQVGQLVAFIQYAVEALFSLSLFTNIFIMYPRANVSAHRLQEIMDAPITVQEPENPITETNGEGTLRFEHVDFSYPDAEEPVLRDINFEAKAGETVAFIGSTGSGKSSIVKLIPRFYDVTKGRITLDGIDIRDLSLETLRSKIGYTPQTANLFTGHISDNLRFGKEDATQGEMERATSISQAEEFISKTNEGFDTELVEGGRNLSGGQKQRLSIARSVIGNHEVYIFDDSFSALDFKTDAAVRERLARETANATTLIVAQRVGSIMQADQIIVLDHGKVAARGTHKELLKTSPLYHEIAASQLSEEELAQ